METLSIAARDSLVLERVARLRERMGLETLPTELSVSELDPLLQQLLENGAHAALSPAVLQEQWWRWLSFNKKWDQWADWSRWDKVS